MQNELETVGVTTGADDSLAEINSEEIMAEEKLPDERAVSKFSKVTSIHRLYGFSLVTILLVRVRPKM